MFFEKFKDAYTPKAPAHHVEREMKDIEDLELILDANERIDECVKSFTATGFQDVRRLERDLKLEKRLGHKSEEQTRNFFANILNLSARELELSGGDENKVKAIDALVIKLRKPELAPHTENSVT